MGTQEKGTYNNADKERGYLLRQIKRFPGVPGSVAFCKQDAGRLRGKFLRGSVVHFLERPVECGVICKSAGLINVSRGFSRIKLLAGQCQPALGDVVVNGNTNLLFEDPLQMEFADEEFFGNHIEGKVIT